MIIDSKKLLYLFVFLIFIAAISFLGVQSWILPIALIVLVAFFLLTTRQPKMAVLLLLLTKPIIDATWSLKVPLLELNFLQITGVAFPVVVFFIIYSNRVQFRHYKVINLYGLFVFLNLISYVVSTFGLADSLFSGLFNFIKYSGFLFQFLNSFTAYLIMPFIFESEKDRKQLFWVLVLSGVFPAITGILQISGITEGRTLRTTGDLVRISGLYHDSTNMRMYAFQTLLAIYIFMRSFLNINDKFYLLQKIICFGLIPVHLLIIYKGYSKAALGILLSWVLIYFVFNRKVFIGVAFLVILGASYVYSDTISNETEKLLYKEIKYAEGSLPEELQYTLLGGRFVYWGVALDNFLEQDLISQFIGYNYIGAAAIHNDFIRILVSNGILGLCVYLLMLVFFTFSLLNAYWIHKDVLSIGAIMIFVSFIIDSIGLVPLLYPGYCWIVFGIVSLSLNRNIFRHSKDIHEPVQRTIISTKIFKTI